MRRFLDNFLVVATGRWIVSLASVIACLPFILFFSLERESSLGLKNFSLQLMAVTAGVLVSLLYIFIVQGTLINSRKEKTQHIMLCLFVWFSTGCVEGVVTDLYANYVLNSESQMLERVLYSFLTTGLILSLAAYWFGNIDKIRNENNALLVLDGLLSIDNSQLNKSQIESKYLAIHNLHDTLLPKVTQIKDLAMDLKKLAASKQIAESFNELEKKSEDLYRKLESKLNSIEKSQESHNIKPKNHVGPADFISGIFPREISIGTSFVFLFLGAVISQSSRNGLPGAIVGLISSIIIVLVILLLHKIGSAKNILDKNWFIAFVFLNIFIVQYLYADLFQIRLFQLENPYLPVYSAFKTLGGVYIASLVTTMLNMQNNFYSFLSSENIAKIEKIQKLNESNEELEKLTVSTIFGVVQGKISGVIMALNVLSENNGFITANKDLPKFIDETKSLINDAIWEIQNIQLKELSR